ncbi:DgyrCDS8304 [Dimorphilus gyrociliatus]|uniref:DgyrCDS8304 n=1 Tax=Dimorphilus gyrociliatus TaxID=2664684 RepID=A0A7I8VVC3_9ANNE|nr:DgyrCDS8304 [Dimorphilus gyrociliatus]
MASSGRLSGKVAIVTASTEGIGFAIARQLGQEGAHVVVSSRSEAKVDKAVNSLKQEGILVNGLVCHVGKEDHRLKLIEEAAKIKGSIDILVSNAAVNPVFGPMLNTDDKAWSKIMDLNVKASFFLCKETVPYMEKAGGGSVMFVTSIAGYQPFSLLGAYSVSKTALIGLVKALTPELASRNIRVNGIAPGIIKTNFSQALTSDPEAEAKVLESVPMQRVGKPEDIAGTAAFLASDDSKYLTGETICITGGMASRL